MEAEAEERVAEGTGEEYAKCELSAEGDRARIAVKEDNQQRFARK